MKVLTLVLIVTLLLLNHTWCYTLNSSIYDFNYLINQRELCETEGRVDLLFWIHSAPKYWKRRVVIRETWGNMKHMPENIRAKLVFFTGALNNDTLTQGRLEFEAEKYGDIIQEDYIDSYKNLTYKAMSALKWINKYCGNADLILKADDDVLVDIHLLVRHLQHLLNTTTARVNKTIICDVFKHVPVIRDKNSKWFVSESDYEGKHYPRYCPGLALIMSADLVPRLLEKANETRYYWIDDVFITGILTEHMKLRWETMGHLFSFGYRDDPVRDIQHSKGNILFYHMSQPVYRVDRFIYLWNILFPMQI